MMRTHIHRLRDLLIHNNINLHPLFRLTSQHPIESPFRMIRRRTTKIKFRSKPPILFKVSHHISGCGPSQSQNEVTVEVEVESIGDIDSKQQ